jgi:hypothetical protein
LLFLGLIFLGKKIWCFLGSSCRETAKNAINKTMGKDDRGKVFFSQPFSAKSFWHGLSPKSFYGVFELPLLRNAQKNAIKNLKKGF